MGAPSPYSETARKLVHIAFGAAALLLRYLQWWQAVLLAAAAVGFNIRILRSLTGHRLHRPHELDRAYPAGLVLYPTSILLLLLMLPSRFDIVAAAWGTLAAGDGAATLVGRRFGGRTWPWNRQKSLAGSAAFVVCGSAAAVFLAWWCRPNVIPPPYWWFSLAAPIVAVLVAAAVETVPVRLDDNVSVPITAAAVLWAFSFVNDDLARQAALRALSLLPLAVAANAAVASAGYAARTVSAAGAITGAAIGVAIFVTAGWQGWSLLLAAFLCASATSRLGLERKTLLGIAEEHEGRRGPGNAIANTGVAAVAAMVAVVSYAEANARVAFAAALTAGASDTVASEIGKAWARRTWSLVPLGEVRPGTHGAISLEGTAAGVLAAAVLAVAAALLGLIPSSAVIAVVAGALIGSFVESLLSAAFEGPGLLNNDALNLINTATAAFAAVSIVRLIS